MTRRPPTGASEPLVFGVVGLGYWGPNILRALAEMPLVEVKWICDLEEQRLERLGRRYPACQRSVDVDALLEDEAVDAIVIATPVFTHFDLGTSALSAGKHVFVEKPLAPSTEGAIELQRLADSQELELMCGHTFIYSPPVRAIKSLLDVDALGEVFFVSSNRVNLGLHQRDISVIWDLGPHDFSILLYLLEEMPRKVRAIGRDSIVPGIPDVAFVTLVYESGIVANVELSWLAPSKLRRTVIVGSQKMVVYDDGAAEPVRIFDHGVVYRDPETFGQYHLSYRTGDILSPNIAIREPLVEELDDFVSAIRFGHEPESTPNLARQVVELAEAADESLHRGGAEIEVGRAGRFSAAGSEYGRLATRVGS